MGTARLPVTGSGRWPAWTASVWKPNCLSLLMTNLARLGHDQASAGCSRIGLRHRQAGELADPAHGIAREKAVNVLLVGLAVAKALATALAQRQHHVVHRRQALGLLVIVAEVPDQLPVVHVKFDPVALRQGAREVLVPVIGINQEPLFVGFDDLAVDVELHSQARPVSIASASLGEPDPRGGEALDVSQGLTDFDSN